MHLNLESINSILILIIIPLPFSHQSLPLLYRNVVFFCLPPNIPCIDFNRHTPTQQSPLYWFQLTQNSSQLFSTHQSLPLPSIYLSYVGLWPSSPHPPIFVALISIVVSQPTNLHCIDFSKQWILFFSLVMSLYLFFPSTNLCLPFMGMRLSSLQPPIYTA